MPAEAQSPSSKSSREWYRHCSFDDDVAPMVRVGNPEVPNVEVSSFSFRACVMGHILQV